MESNSIINNLSGKKHVRNENCGDDKNEVTFKKNY